MDVTLPGADPRIKSERGIELTMFVVCMAASWLLFLFWPLSLGMEFVGVVYLNSRRSRLLTPMLLLNATVVISSFFVVKNIVGYFDGTAETAYKLNEPGRIGSFSPRLRCNAWFQGADLFIPAGFVTTVPSDLTLHACCALLGPVRHTYHGPLPRMSDAHAILADPDTQRLPRAEIITGSFEVSGVPITLQPEAISMSNYLFEFSPPGIEIELQATETAQSRVALFKRQCLIVLTLGEKVAGWVTSDTQFWIVTLIDPATGKAFSQDYFNE